MSRQRSRTRKVSHQINSVSSSLESNWRMVEHYPTITSKRINPSLGPSVERRKLGSFNL